METVIQRLERLYLTDNWSQHDREWLAEYLKGDISELYLIALDGFSKDILEKKISLSEAASDHILSSIHMRIQPPARVFPLRRLFIRLSVAASITAVFCTAYFLGNRFVNRAVPVKYLETIAAKGEVKLIQLADGSSIWLNADSRLKYPEQFNGKTREVTLTGEAFFAVVHDKSKPFIIHSDKINTSVLGTSFNIKAYAADETIKVTVVEGKVGVVAKALDATQKAIFLTPNTQLVFTKSTGAIKKDTFDAASIASWQQGKLHYRNTPLPDVIADLQRKYNVVIKADKNLLNCTLYADFDNLPMQKVLKIICSLINAHVLKEGDGYRLRGKGCN